jgi:tetratricopeptide (TPR) repeat protein
LTRALEPRALRSSALALAILSLACTTAWAQTPGNQPLERQVDEAFRQSFRAPADGDATARYARLLTQSGNFEGAIAALERLLLDPNASPSVRVELGVLYYRLDSHDMAASLLNRALADPRLDPALRSQVQALLKDIEQRTRVSRLDGQVTLGLRAQTNPSSRTSSDTVLTGGASVAVPANLQPKSDTDVQLGLRLNHEYDLGRQNEATLVSTLAAQIVKFSSSSGSTLQAGGQVAPYNLALLDVSTGLRFKPLASAPNLSIRPHLIAATLAAQGHRYLNNHGVGLDAAYSLGDRTFIDGGYEYRYNDHATRVDVPDANDLDGTSNQLRVRVTRELAPGQLLSGELRTRWQRTRLRLHDMDSQEMRVTYLRSYASPFQGGGLWTTSVWGGVQRRSFDGADPAIDPNTPRRDTELRIGIGQTVPLTAAWSLLMQLEHTTTDSSLPNYDNKNTSLFVAGAYRF